MPVTATQTILLFIGFRRFKGAVGLGRNRDLMVPAVKRTRLGIVTPGIQRIPTLAALLDDFELVREGKPRPGTIDALATWGRKAHPPRSAAALARLGALPEVHLEDGFLRSVLLGDTAPPLSVVVDDLGVHYDAGAPSRLEALIAAPVDDAAAARARSLMAAWCAARVSKYNHAREFPVPVDGDYVLVVDQTRGDFSIGLGLADEESFVRMLAAARSENPGCRVLLKTHPDVVAGRKAGHFSAEALQTMPDVTVISGLDHPVPLIEGATAVYVVTSQLGFEALIWGRKVRCFGMPFYAGWGLTADELPAPARRGRASLDALVHATLVDYPRYLDPETGQRCTVERLVDWMGLQRRMRQRLPARLHGMGFTPRKQQILRAFAAGSDISFGGLRRPPPAGATPVVWGRRPAPPGAIRVEDGFLRSSGLGIDLVQPLSWVFDRSGIYFDATAPSDLETLLNTAVFTPELLERAARLRHLILDLNITKYSLPAAAWARPALSREIILVPGQVQTDASIRFGAGTLNTNLALLQAVRAARPDAHIVYKPHPDVVAGLRSGDSSLDRGRAFFDELVTEADMSQMLAAVDAVHTLTSLSGFEALMRGKPVTCYGRPFYAGWGLTEDRLDMPRRQARLSLDALVAGAIILYPTYVNRVSGGYTTAEQAVRDLARWRDQGGGSEPTLQRRLWRGLRRFWIRTGIGGAI